MHYRKTVTLLALCAAAICACCAHAGDLDGSLAKIRAVGAKGEGHQTAISALKDLRETSTKDLMTILSAMDGANKVACNWLRSVAESAVERGTSQGQALPVKDLEAFLADRKHSPLGRRFAYELITSVDPSAETRLLPGFLNDESMELRRDAVALLLKGADAAEKGGNTDEAKKINMAAYQAARLPEQVKAIAEKLGKLGVEVDFATHFGLVQNWHAIGPFDHTDSKAFDVAYPPEKAVNLAEKLQGKNGEVAWVPVVTKKQDGVVDLNELLGKEKFAIAYAFNEFESDKDQDIEIRYGCINGSKVWVNGELVAANDVYHTGQEIDQYRGKAKLKKGKNQILVKVCQNNQTEQWAQDWQFLLRVCDSLGTAVLSSNRPAVKMDAPPPPPMPNAPAK
jgi:hypothetical protein